MACDATFDEHHAALFGASALPDRARLGALVIARIILPLLRPKTGEN